MNQHFRHFALAIILILIHSQTFPKNRGITNCGNSCYFNSCIQCLSNMNDLNRIFNVDDYQPGSIPRLYIKMLPLLKTKKRPLKINSPIEYPETIASFYVTAAQIFFKNQYQSEDASEFLTKFLNCFENKFENKQDAIDSLLGFTMTTKTRCKICQNISTIFSAERILNVDIPKRGSPTIMNCLNTISDPQFLNDYQCDVCNRHVEAIKHTYFFTLPKYLIISLNRFKNINKKFQKAVK